jgi:hypothetical protein
VDFNQTAWLLAISITTVRLIQPEKLRLEAIVGDPADAVDEGDELDDETGLLPPDLQFSNLFVNVMLGTSQLTTSYLSYSLILSPTGAPGSTGANWGYGSYGI